MTARENEMKLIIQSRLNAVWSSFVWGLSPTLVMLTSFLWYVQLSYFISH
jgi:hypothetical protein